MGIIELIDWALGYILSNFFSWYADQIQFNFDFVTLRLAFLEVPVPQFIFRFPSAILFLFAIFLIVQLLFMILPSWVEKIVKGACFLFAALHAYAHVQTAKDLQGDIARTKGKTISKLEEETKRRDIFVRTYYRVTLGGWRPESTSIFIGCNTVKDTITVAMAPLRSAVIIFFFYMFIISPLTNLMGLFGLLIHIYFSVAVFGVLMPSGTDYKVIYLSMMEAGLVPKWAIYYSFVVFAFVGGNVLLLTGGDGFSAFIMALFFSTLYLICLFTVIRLFAREKELEYPLRSLIPQKKEEMFTVKDIDSFLIEDFNY
jgi:hypothetical protein